MNIWQIQQEYLAIFDELEENGGELTEEIEQQLAITQESFKSKIESYANVIKMTKADIAAIDEEKKRLDALKKSKNSLIERLSKIMIDAIEMFGEESRSGSKFVDYGTGKISIRKSQKIELDDDKVNCISNELGKAFAVEVMLGGASNREDFTFEDIIQRCKEHTVIEEDSNSVVDAPQEVTTEDISNTVIEITFRQNITDLMKGDGYNLMKSLITYNSGVNFTPKIDKTQLKNELKDSSGITIGKIVQNQTLAIK